MHSVRTNQSRFPVEYDPNFEKPRKDELPLNSDMDRRVNEQTVRHIVFNSGAKLNSRERKVLQMRYYGDGIKGPLTLSEIGAIFNVSKERIRQIQEQAHRKIQEFLG
jgi:RNA polymerase sigma factor (sigma-70 family)